jgi:hypothetical protein
LLPNAIIGGAQKAGTTSLFRYLSDHPRIFPSAVKEIDFFIDYANQMKHAPLEKYYQYFNRCYDNTMIRIEASPRYLMKGEQVAKNIQRYLPDVKLLFILRDPVSLLLSYIKWKSNQTGRKRSLDQILTAIDETTQNTFNPNAKIENGSVFIRLQAGCYVKFLKYFFEFFPQKNIGIFFYDDLADNPQLLMKKICSFLQIDNKFYGDYAFHIENRSRYYKYPNIHKFARQTNARTEKFLNRYPAIRRGIRVVYNKICETTPHQNMLSGDIKVRIDDFYAGHNQKLYYLLHKNYPDLDLPKWLITAKQIS